MISPTSAPPMTGAPLSALRQWVELDPDNGGPPVDDPSDEDAAAATAADNPPPA
ncbi:hypothetical protein [Azospirillum agricola]|uniref:hypothetical protein n=1 Tax=Azospirillum agricola TaxID=1720247 RepID=UPI000A0F1D50|nr:hypothetical protein [Azospirillum agricola]SMH45277.1 hypothetical protein SAMN02982994_2220 [Azospirillum lipoferum]